ncbi:Isochorismatase hydrolase [Leucogyrophana mollusca]|uniref:Isochorismatase hydrolase n=1 Tax=Leucogyrophana mollusca TaxID=85980 RepID=A0ACB8BUS6_9AGAM|nr:Isochorismatase hydrolase [Leucogyrophana mollusca]
MAFTCHPDAQGSSCEACRVLLLVDAQVGMLADPPNGVPSAKIVRQNIQRILEQARVVEHPPRIIHVRNTGDVGEVDEPNTPGWQLAFPPLPHEYVIDKLKNNAFAGTHLGDLIAPEAEIIVVGMQSDFCIRATCSAALGRGNEVLLIRGAHATYDRLEVWNGGGITPANAIEAEIEAELEEAGVALFDMKDLPGLFTDR